MISPALHFQGDCQEAIELYEQAFDGADKSIQLYDTAPDGSGLNAGGGMAGKVMHASLTICGTPVNFSDSETPVTVGDNLCMNVFMPSREAVEHAYAVLARDGRVAVPLGPQFFNPLYAAVVDRYGVRWQIMVG